MLRRSIQIAAAAILAAGLLAPGIASAQPAPGRRGDAPTTNTGRRGGPPVTADTPTTIARQPQMPRHLEFMDVAAQGDIDLVFLGDSITDGWRGRGLSVWGKTWAPLKAADFGIGGEQVEQTLWRVENGELDSIKPKAVVVMIGTNNLATRPNRMISEGIKALVASIRMHAPQAKVLLLGIFPRATSAADPLRQRIKDINAEIAKLDDGNRIHYMDIGAKFLEADGSLSPEIMPDALHPNARGYQIWADATLSKVKELMGAK